jgi:hypothetical protein
MRRIANAARLIAAAFVVVSAALPMKAGAAGVYENAAAEPAFLLSPRRPTFSADLDFSVNDPIEAAIYRIGATFPVTPPRSIPASAISPCVPVRAHGPANDARSRFSPPS